MKIQLLDKIKEITFPRGSQDGYKIKLNNEVKLNK